MIDTSMWENEKFGALPMGAKLLQVGMINHADDQGRVKAHPVYLSKAIFPYDEDVSIADIRKWLELLQINGTIILYAHDEKQYAQLTNWWKYQSLQYAQPSDYPRPEGWKDRIRRTLTKGHIVTCNWFKVNGDPIPDTCDMDGNAIGSNGAGYRPPPRNPQNNQPPPDNAAMQSHDQSYGDSPDHSPEYSGDDTTYSLNENENLKLQQPRARASEAKAGGGGGGGGGVLRQENQEFAEICTAIECNGFGMMTQILSDEVTDLLKDYPSPWILDAMKIAVKANKRKINYVAGVLRKWRADGRDPPQAAQAPSPPAKVDYAIAGML